MLEPRELGTLGIVGARSLRDLAADRALIDGHRRLAAVETKLFERRELLLDGGARRQLGGDHLLVTVGRAVPPYRDLMSDQLATRDSPQPDLDGVAQAFRDDQRVVARGPGRVEALSLRGGQWIPPANAIEVPHAEIAGLLDLLDEDRVPLREAEVIDHVRFVALEQARERVKPVEHRDLIAAIDGSPGLADPHEDVAWKEPIGVHHLHVAIR